MLRNIIKLETAIKTIVQDHGVPESYIRSAVEDLYKENVIELLYAEVDNEEYFLSYDDFKYLEEYVLENTADWIEDLR